MFHHVRKRQSEARHSVIIPLEDLYPSAHIPTGFHAIIGMTSLKVTPFSRCPGEIIFLERNTQRPYMAYRQQASARHSFRCNVSCVAREDDVIRHRGLRGFLRLPVQAFETGAHAVRLHPIMEESCDPTTRTVKDREIITRPNVPANRLKMGLPVSHSVIPLPKG